MKNVINVLKTVAMGICAVLVLGSMGYMVLMQYLPKDPVFEERKDFAEKRAQERLEEKAEEIRQQNKEERLRIQECQNSETGCNPFPEGAE